MPGDATQTGSELSHEEQPGCRKAFWVVLAVMTLVLVVALSLGPELPANAHH
jgi:hypothetical protein